MDIPPPEATSPPGSTQPTPRSSERGRDDGAAFTKSWAVVVGIDAYENGIEKLRTARADAEAVGKLLSETHGYHLVLRTDAEATREGLHRLLTKELPAQVQAGDRVFFYFAGHGVALDGDGGPEGFLVPQDARADDEASLLSMRDVHDALAGLRARHLLVVLDCCFAGAFQWYAFRHLRPVPPRLYRQHLQAYVAHPARQILTSAAHDQRALDTILEGRVLGARGSEGEHSPFAQALLDGLGGEADAAQGGLRGDGVITATELYLYVRRRLQPGPRHPEQTPQLWPMRGHGRGEFVFLPGGTLPALPDAPEMAPENNPYRGLLPFDFGQKDLFFGRSRLVKELREKVTRHRLVAVLGPSGSGKSSLVRAGLVPDLRAFAPGGWTVADPVRPGRDPWLALASSLAGPLGEPAEAISRTLRERLSALRERMAAWKERTGGTLLVVLDQFEELFTEAHSPGADAKDDQAGARLHAERERFLERLAAAVSGEDVGLRVVVTARADFEPRFLDTPLRAAWMEGRYNVRPMSADELRETIEGPAAVRALVFEPPREGSLPELVRRLIDDVLQMPGALPLLSFTLSQLYLKAAEAARGDRTLREQDYDDLGTAVGALRKRADEIFKGLAPAEQDTMRRLMLRLGHFEAGQATRRRVPLWELEHQDPEEQKRIDAVRERLVEERLIVSGDEPVLGSFVEAAHDALLLGWTRLWEWVRKERPTPPEYRRLTEAVDEWRDDGENPKRLWDQNPSLPPFERALRENPIPLAKDEGRFVSSSRSRRWRRRVTTAAGVAAAAAVIAGGVWLFSRQSTGARSEQALDDWTQAQEERERDPFRALLKMTRAVARAPDGDSNLRLYALAAAHMATTAPDFVVRLSETGGDHIFSEDGRFAAVAGHEDNSVQVYTLPEGRRLPTPLDTLGKAYTTTTPFGAFSQDGSRVAVLMNPAGSPGAANWLWVWETKTSRLLARVQLGAEWTHDIAFSPGAHSVVVLSGDEDGSRARIIRLEGAGPAGAPSSGARPVEVQIADPSGSHWAGAHATDELEVVRSGGLSEMSGGSGRALLALIRNVSGGQDHEVHLLDPATGEPAGPPLRPGARVVQVRLSPGGRVAAILTPEGDSVRIRVMETLGGRDLPGSRRLSSEDRLLHVGDDGSRVLVSQVDSTSLQVWEADLRTDARRFVVTRIGSAPGAIERLWTSRNGQYLFLLRRDGGMKVWSVANGVGVAHLGSLPAKRVEAWSTSPGGQVSAAMSGGLVARWDPLRHPLPSQVRLTEHSLVAAAFSPDGGRLALAWRRHPDTLYIQAIDPSTRRLGWPSAAAIPVQAGSEIRMTRLRWSVDGKYLVARVRDRSGSRERVTVLAGDRGVAVCPHIPMEEVGHMLEGTRRLAISKDPADPFTPTPLTLAWWTLPGCTAGSAPDRHPRTGDFVGFGGGGEYYLHASGRTAVIRTVTSGDSVFSVPWSNQDAHRAFQATFAQAVSLEVVDAVTLVLRLSGGEVRWSADGGILAGTTSGGRGVHVAAGAYPFYSPDARWYVARAGRPGAEDSLAVFDADKALPISGTFWNAPRAEAYFLSAEGRELRVVTVEGGLRRWPVAVAVTRRPVWMEEMGGALTGMRLTGDGDATEALSAQEHAAARDRFLKALHDAAARGDSLAAMVARRFPRSEDAVTPSLRRTRKGRPGR